MFIYDNLIFKSIKKNLFRQKNAFDLKQWAEYSKVIELVTFDLN